MIRFILVLVITASLNLYCGATHAASIPESLSSLPLDQCNFQRVIDILIVNYSTKEAEISINLLAAYKKLKEISSLAKEPNKPIKEQLSKDNLIEFNNLTQRIKIMRIATLVESRKLRDLKVIREMTEIADYFYRWNRFPNLNKDQEIIVAVLAFLLSNYNLKDEDLIKKSPDTCSLDYALYKIQKEPLKKALDKGKIFKRDLTVFEYNHPQLKNKNKSKFTSEEKKLVTDFTNKSFAPFNHELTYLEILYFIREFSRMSDFMHQTYIQDTISTGGNIDQIGKTIKGIDESTSNNNWLVLKAWEFINEKIPSDAIKQNNEILKAIEKQSIKSQ